MRNPWMAKNPLLSLWLSGANALLSYSRSIAMAEAQRQYAMMMSRQLEHWMRLWTPNASVSAGKKTRRARKRQR